jgi:short-subunit dehydrogenase
MVKKKIIKKILILGSSSEMAKEFIKSNHDLHKLILVGRKSKYKLEDFLKSNSKIKNDYNVILFFIGKFIKNYENLNSSIQTINFEFLKKCIYKNFTNYKKNKRPIKFIVITSLDSIFPNKNSLEYSVSKAASSHMILNFQKFHKETKINYFDIQPGAVKTTMLRKKTGNAMNTAEITKTIDYILSLDDQTSLFPIRLFPKKNSYSKY